MFKKIITLCALAVCSIAIAQEESEFTSKPIITIFSNYNYGLGDESENSGFEIDRAYLGYGFDYKEELSGQFVVDFGSTEIDSAGLDLVAFIKNAFVTWEKFGLEASFGLIKTYNFGFQENFWSYRYVAKSFQDEEGFAPSADFGLSVAYNFTDWIKADFQVTNGEGHKRLILDNSQRYGLGVTVEPVSNFFVRGHYDIYASSAENADLERTMSLFAGYKNDRFSVGAEYNYKWNTDFVLDNDFSGTSFYGRVNMIDKLSVYAKYDYVQKEDDRSKIIGGLEYAPYKFLKISPNVKSDISHTDNENATFLFLNVQIKI